LPGRKRRADQDHMPWGGGIPKPSCKEERTADGEWGLDDTGSIIGCQMKRIRGEEMQPAGKLNKHGWTRDQIKETKRVYQKSKRYHQQEFYITQGPEKKQKDEQRQSGKERGSRRQYCTASKRQEQREFTTDTTTWQGTEENIKK